MLYYVNINLILYYERFILQIKIKNCKLIYYYIPQNHLPKSYIFVKFL